MKMRISKGGTNNIRSTGRKRKDISQNIVRKDGMGMANYIIELLGGMDNLLSALVVFIVINYITDIFVAIAEKERHFKVFLLKNVFKKAAIFILVIISNTVGTIIESNCAIRMAVILFYISNEGLAILENINRLGVPLPQILIEILNQLRTKK